MLEKINERVDVITIYRKFGGQVLPYKIRWSGKDYLIKKLGYHHKVKEGRFVYHYFSVSTDTLAFKLKHDPESLYWILMEVSDGNPN